MSLGWVLAAIHPRQTRVVVFRYFVGLSEEEIAQALHISTVTVTRAWRMDWELTCADRGPEPRAFTETGHESHPQ